MRNWKNGRNGLNDNERLKIGLGAHMYATLKDTLKANVILQKCNGDIRESVALGILIPRDPHSMFKDSWTTTIDLGDGEKKPSMIGTKSHK